MLTLVNVKVTTLSRLGISVVNLGQTPATFAEESDGATTGSGGLGGLSALGADNDNDGGEFVVL